MVEVFRTNVQDEATANHIVSQLQKRFPKAKINFDLEDCDRILRIEDVMEDFKIVPRILSNMGYTCEVLFA